MGGRNYTWLTEKQLDGEMADFPPLDTKRCEREANSLFKTWLFVKDTRGMREITCSSCGHSEKLLTPMRIMDEKWAWLMGACHDQPATCPWCGAGGKIKERRYIRNGVKLTEYHPVLFLQEKDGVLYAQGFWTRKLYDSQMDATQLGQPPLFMETEACRFRIGRADGYTRSGWDGRYIRTTVEGNYGRNHWIREAFTSGIGYYSGFEAYTIFGSEAYYHSKLRYCGYEIYRGRPKLTDGTICGDLIRYLTAATQYPQQIERIAKAGWRGLIDDLIYQRKKNVAILKWEEPDLKKSLGLSGEELKTFRDAKCSPYLIGEYKKFRKAGIPASYEDLRKLNEMPWGSYHEALKLCLHHGIRPGRLVRYLEEHTGTVNSIAVSKYRYETFQIWKDWLDMAGKLGYDLKNETVLLPKELGRKHDEAAEELNRRTLREERKARAARIKERRKKYAAEINGFVFRPAESSREIVAEGKALQHCVGGYAERHMAGKLTICFVRRVENPEASLYTIEMHGAELIQIHGFKNERMPGSKNPREVVGPELDAWLAWIKRGSKRDKQGNPVLPDVKDKKEVKIA